MLATIFYAQWTAPMFFWSCALSIALGAVILTLCWLDDWEAGFGLMAFAVWSAGKIKPPQGTTTEIPRTAPGFPGLNLSDAIGAPVFFPKGEGK
jgi:hypothetical protein